MTRLCVLRGALARAIVDGDHLLVVDPVEEQRLEQVLVNFLDQGGILGE